MNGMKGYRDEKRVKYPREVPDKKLKNVKNKFVTNKQGHLYNEIFKKCKKEYFQTFDKKKMGNN